MESGESRPVSGLHLSSDDITKIIKAMMESGPVRRGEVEEKPEGEITPLWCGIGCGGHQMALK